MSRTRTLLSTAALAVGSFAFAGGGGTARVQVIHNCADLSAATVDIYLDDALLLDNFAFRTASPFIDAPAGVDFTISVAADTSENVGESFFQEDFNLTSGETYIITASGIVSATGYTPNPGFSLEVFSPGQEASLVAGNTDVLVFHGSTDAPTVDIYEGEVLEATVVDGISYGEYSGYSELSTAQYILQVRNAAQTAVVSTYRANLAAIGPADSAIVVLASGFLDPASNSNGPSFGLWAATVHGGALVQLPLIANPTAKVQVVHNSADLGADTVDVYVNDAIVLDDLAFRHASAFLSAPATLAINISIAPKASTSVADAFYSQTFDLADSGTYVMAAEGIVSGSGYTPNPAFGLSVYDQGRQTATAGHVDVLVHHGSTDAPTVDVFESGVLNTTAVDDASYGDYAGYLELTADDYILQVRTADNGTIVGTYDAPLQTLGLTTSAITIFASGFLDPANNSDGPAFGLWFSKPTGGALVELTQTPNPTARIQLIHNSADAAVSIVDVWVDDTLRFDDLDFRSATPFFSTRATLDIDVAVAPADSDEPSDALAQLTINPTAAGSYIVTANGIVSPSGYNPATPFSLDVKAGAREVGGTPGSYDLLFCHGSTDAPAIVDVAEIAFVDATIVDDLGYAGYSIYLTAPHNDYVFQVQSSTGTPIATYSAALATMGLDGSALTIVASGFVDPSDNSDGPGFGLWMAQAAGGPLTELPIYTAIDEHIGALAGASVWPNPASDLVTLSLYATAEARTSLRITDLSGRMIMEQGNVPVPVGETRLTIPVNTLAAGSYQLTITSGNTVRTLPLQVVR